MLIYFRENGAPARAGATVLGVAAQRSSQRLLMSSTAASTLSIT